MNLKKYFKSLLIIHCFLLAFGCAETSPDNSNSAIPLAGPSSVQVTANNGALVVQWTRVAPAQGIDPYYELYYSGTSAEANNAIKCPDVPADPTSNLVRATISNLNNYQTYYIWVKAIFPGLGSSAFSPTVYAIPIPPPSPPTGLIITPSEAMLQLNWQDGDSGDRIVTAVYEVYYLANGSTEAPPDDAALVTAPETGAAIHGLLNSTPYKIWLRASNTAGKSIGWISGNGTPAVQDSAPTGTPDTPTVTSGDGKLTLTWQQVSGVPKYKLYYSTTNDFSGATEFSEIILAASPIVRADITGLSNNLSYYVWVQVWNSQCVNRNSSPHSANIAQSVKPQPKPAINWNDLNFELGSAASEYIYAQDLAPSVFFPEGRPNTDRITRVQEAALGNLFCDGTAWYMRKHFPAENIDFVFINGGYIDNALQRGRITTGSLSMVADPGARVDKLYLVTLTGLQLKIFFDEVADIIHTGRGGPHETGFFGMVSAEARYTIQYRIAPEGTSHNPPLTSHTDPATAYYLHGIIKSGTLKINGQDIVDDHLYRICTTDYVAAGEYFTTLYIEGTNKTPINKRLWEAVAEYIYDRATVSPYLDGRVKLEGGVPLPPPWIQGTRE
jgi:hypothetical protein